MVTTVTFWKLSKNPKILLTYMKIRHDLRMVIVLFVIAWSALAYSQSSPHVIRNPRNMSSSGMLTMIQEYEDGLLLTLPPKTGPSTM